MFAKLPGKFCGQGRKCNIQEEPRFGNYLSFEEAAIACSNNFSCEMVMDRSCDDQGPYELCSSSNVCDSGEGTCSYKRIERELEEMPGEQTYIVPIFLK